MTLISLPLPRCASHLQVPCRRAILSSISSSVHLSSASRFGLLMKLCIHDCLGVVLHPRSTAQMLLCYAKRILVNLKPSLCSALSLGNSGTWKGSGLLFKTFTARTVAAVTAGAWGSLKRAFSTNKSLKEEKKPESTTLKPKQSATYESQLKQ